MTRGRRDEIHPSCASFGSAPVPGEAATKAAASALNSTFGAALFTTGLKLGTASTLLRF